MIYYDTHAHPDHPLVEDRTGYVKKMMEKGIKGMVVAPITYDSNYSSMEMFPEEEYPNVFFAKGLHPKCASNSAMWSAVEKQQFEELLLDKRVVAVKSGIDLSKKKLQEAQVQRQYYFLKMFMNFAKKHKKPMVLHIRNAAQEAINFFSANPLQVPTEIHCFTYDIKVMMQFRNLGIDYFGIGGMVTRSDNTELQEAVKKMPLHSILLESDAPFVKVEGETEKINTSAQAIPIVASKIAELKGISEKEVIEVTYQNACRFFGLN